MASAASNIAKETVVSLSAKVSSRILAGTIASVGVLSGLAVMSVSQWKPGTWPGDDPTIPPGEGFEWRGQLPVGGDKGAWVNSSTGDSLHPDLNHPKPIDPHWDWVNKLKKIFVRIFK